MTDQANPADIDELDRLHTAATPGEWWHCVGHGVGSTAGRAVHLGHDGAVNADQLFAIAAHNTWEAVSSELRSARARIAELEAAIAASALGRRRRSSP